MAGDEHCGGSFEPQDGSEISACLGRCQKGKSKQVKFGVKRDNKFISCHFVFLKQCMQKRFIHYHRCAISGMQVSAQVACTALLLPFLGWGGSDAKLTLTHGATTPWPFCPTPLSIFVLSSSATRPVGLNTSFDSRPAAGGNCAFETFQCSARFPFAFHAVPQADQLSTGITTPPSLRRNVRRRELAVADPSPCTDRLQQPCRGTPKSPPPYETLGDLAETCRSASLVVAVARRQGSIAGVGRQTTDQPYSGLTSNCKRNGQDAKPE